ncbi:hypothetical protein HR12_45780, partial [Microbacterium sp. SUBG005]
LALAAQKYPDATGDQLVQALLTTTNATRHDPTRTEDGYGYGAAWLPTLLSVDATTFPDESPLMNKPVGAPTPEQIDTAKTEGFVPSPSPAAWTNTKTRLRPHPVRTSHRSSSGSSSVSAS